MFGHKFKTQKQTEKRKTLQFICFCLVFLIVFGSVSAVVYLKNSGFSLNEYFINRGERKEQTTEPEEKKKPEGKMNLLFYCCDEDPDELYFIFEVVADMNNSAFKIYPLDPNDPGYLSALKSGGEEALEHAVEKRTGMKTDAYAASDKKSFAVAVNYMDGLEFFIENRVEYRTENTTLILPQGTSKLNGDDLIGYLKYCKTVEATGLKMQGEVMQAMLENYITEENLENGIKIFQKLLDKIKMNSDISYIEATGYIDELKLYLTDENRKDPEIILR